jgi:hypothetical protein
MNLPQNTISENQMSNNLSTVLDYTSSSGSRFQFTAINNDSLNRTCGFLHTTLTLYANVNDKKMTALVKEIESIRGVTRVFFINKYKLHIERGDLFDWGNIVMSVIEVLEKTLEQEKESEES